MAAEHSQRPDSPKFVQNAVKIVWVALCVISTTFYVSIYKGFAMRLSSFLSSCVHLFSGLHSIQIVCAVK